MMIIGMTSPIINFAINQWLEMLPMFCFLHFADISKKYIVLVLMLINVGKERTDAIDHVDWLDGASPQILNPEAKVFNPKLDGLLGAITG